MENADLLEDLGYHRNKVFFSCYHRLDQYYVKHIPIPIIKPETELIHIVLEILNRNMMVNTINPTF